MTTVLEVQGKSPHLRRIEGFRSHKAGQHGLATLQHDGEARHQTRADSPWTMFTCSRRSGIMTIIAEKLRVPCTLDVSAPSVVTCSRSLRT